MDGITDFDMKFKRSLIEQLDKMNKTLERIVKEMETQNNLKEVELRDIEIRDKKLRLSD